MISLIVSGNAIIFPRKVVPSVSRLDDYKRNDPQIKKRLPPRREAAALQAS